MGPCSYARTRGADIDGGPHWHPASAAAAHTASIQGRRIWRRTLPRRGLLLLPRGLALLVERAELFAGELHPAAGGILLQVLHLAGAGDGQHHRAALEQPRQRDR